MPKEDIQSDPKASSVPHWTAGIVDEWWREVIPSSPASATVESWNYLLAAKEDLKRRLEKETN